MRFVSLTLVLIAILSGIAHAIRCSLIVLVDQFRDAVGLKSMQNAFPAFVTTLLILTLLVPWLPHGAVHALHDRHQGHSNSGKAHEHDHVAHNHKEQTQADLYYAIKLDVVSCFIHYLHVDLHSSNQVALTAPSQRRRDIDFVLSTDLLLQRHAVAAIQKCGPSPDYDWRTLRSNTPLYLTTQRLLI